MVHVTKTAKMDHTLEKDGMPMKRNFPFWHLNKKKLRAKHKA